MWRCTECRLCLTHSSRHLPEWQVRDCQSRLIPLLEGTAVIFFNSDVWAHFKNTLASRDLPPGLLKLILLLCIKLMYRASVEAEVGKPSVPFTDMPTSCMEWYSAVVRCRHVLGEVLQDSKGIERTPLIRSRLFMHDCIFRPELTNLGFSVAYLIRLGVSVLPPAPTK